MVEERTLNIPQACLLIVGSMAGSGILALPRALSDTGWIGLILLGICSFVFALNGVFYAKCWEMLIERYPNYREHVRDPLPIIAEEALGHTVRLIVAVIQDVSLISIGTIYLLIAAQNMQSLFEEANVYVSFRFWILLLAVILILPSWLPTPKDFWLAATIAAATTGLAGILIILSLSIDKRACLGHLPAVQGVNIFQFISGISTIVFSFNGVGPLLVIQQDMKLIGDFRKAVIWGFLILTGMYIPVAVTGYSICGDSTLTNVLQTLPHGATRLTAEILVTGHMLFAYILIINPVSQHLEQIFDLPKKFCWQQALVRTCLVALTCIFAEVIPRLDDLMSLLGASCVTVLSCLVPSLSYWLLCEKQGPWPDRRLSLHLKVYLIETQVTVIIAGIAGTYVSIVNIFIS